MSYCIHYSAVDFLNLIGDGVDSFSRMAALTIVSAARQIRGLYINALSLICYNFHVISNSYDPLWKDSLASVLKVKPFLEVFHHRGVFRTAAFLLLGLQSMRFLD